MTRTKLRWWQSKPLVITDDDCRTEHIIQLNQHWCTTHHCFITTCNVRYI
ncbi:MAG: hypothetical protein JWO15_3920 [Sphingomonadales bacterium]|nr:hypothetical protein [Sphingomonadales bacterium]